MSVERSLRLFTFLTTAIAVPLEVVMSVVSAIHEHHDYYYRGRSVTTFCFGFIPLTMTVVSAIISLQYTKKHGKSPTGIQFKVLDLVAVLAYIGVLIPIWAVEIRKLRLSGFGLLVGYTTAPMIVNMAIHMYFTIDGLPWNRIFSAIYGLRTSCQQCPNCQQKFLASASTTQTTTKKGYSLLRGEDYLDIEADPIQYRDSEDFLGEGAEHAEYARLPEQANEPEDTDKGKIIIEV